MEVCTLTVRYLFRGAVHSRVQSKTVLYESLYIGSAANHGLVHEAMSNLAGDSRNFQRISNKVTLTYAIAPGEMWTLYTMLHCTCTCVGARMRTYIYTHSTAGTAKVILYG